MSISWHSRFFEEKECRVCGTRSRIVSDSLGVCVDCIHQRPERCLPHIRTTHEKSRLAYGLPPYPPKSANGIQCNLCANECKIGIGEKGFCGLRENIGGKLHSLANLKRGLLYSYLDPQVTNCCAAWFCPAGTGSGYPKYAYRPSPETGYSNLAVFFYGCNFNCLFCQNSSHKELWRSNLVTMDSLVEKVKTHKRISCVCYFGGSPEPQLPFAIAASRRMLEETSRILRICFEWNGCGNPQLVKEVAELALASGGNVKFDLKCFDPNLSLALSGVPNERAYSNFRMVAEEFYEKRREMPVLTATTLLVPGYVDVDEVKAIASFISDLSPEIPYSLLVFHPHFMMDDLPVTPKKQVLDCYRIAKKYLERVHVGNLNLMGVESIDSLNY